MADLATRADRLTSNALGGFHKAHSQLTKANDLLDQHRAEQAEAARAYAAEIARLQAEAEAAQKAADAQYAKNERQIAKIADLLEI